MADKNLEEKILQILHEKNSVSIDEFAGIIQVSPSTIRRKLENLQNKGLVRRTHGGAILNDEKNFLPSFTLRSHQNILEKKKMALAAIKLIKDGDLIFLDGSTSAFFIAEYLSEFKNIKVITNGIDTLSLLSKNHVEAYSTGGLVSPVNNSVLVGHHAVDMIRNIHADFTFFSVQSIDTNCDLYDCFEEENVIRKTMIVQSTKSVLLCDATKFNQFSPYRLCSLSDIDYFASDKQVIDELNLEKLSKRPELIIL